MAIPIWMLLPDKTMFKSFALPSQMQLDLAIKILLRRQLKVNMPGRRIKYRPGRIAHWLPLRKQEASGHTCTYGALLLRMCYFLTLLVLRVPGRVFIFSFVTVQLNYKAFSRKIRNNVNV